MVRGETDPVKRRMGLVPQEVALHDELPARENLALFGAIYGMRGAALRSAMDARVRRGRAGRPRQGLGSARSAAA